MEVASPLAFMPIGGSKRSLSCSPTARIESPPGGRDLSDMEIADDGLRAAKRRRFHLDTSVDSLSEVFSSHSPFFSAGIHNNNNNNKSSIFSKAGAKAALQRYRKGGGSSPPLAAAAAATSSAPNDLQLVVDEQAAVIESLKEEKSKLESGMTSLKTDLDRSQKENQLLRKAVTIQQERQTQAEGQLKAAQEYRTQTDERVRKLEQMVLSLRYHLQAQQPSFGNDFMGLPPRPPDVY